MTDRLTIRPHFWDKQSNKVSRKLSAIWSLRPSCNLNLSSCAGKLRRSIRKAIIEINCDQPCIVLTEISIQHPRLFPYGFNSSIYQFLRSSPTFDQCNPKFSAISVVLRSNFANLLGWFLPVFPATLPPIQQKSLLWVV